MKKFYRAAKKIEYEFLLFLLLAAKLPFDQWKSAGIFFLFSSAAVAAILGQAIRRAEESAKYLVFILIALLLSGDMTKSLFLPSFSFSYTASVTAGAALKTSSLLIFLLSLLILRKSSGLNIKNGLTFLLPVLCGAGILLSPSFAFFFIPVLLVISAYNDIAFSTKIFSRTGLAVFIFSCLICSVFFLVSRSGNYKFLGFLEPQIAFAVLDWSVIGKTLITVFPLIVLFAVLWAGAYQNAVSNSLKRIILFCALEPALVFLLNIFFFYAASDGWKYCIFTVYFTQFLLVLYLRDSGEKPIVCALEKVGGFFRKNLFALFAVMVYLIKSADILFGR